MSCRKEGTSMFLLYMFLPSRPHSSFLPNSITKAQEPKHRPKEKKKKKREKKKKRNKGYPWFLRLPTWTST